ncbi:MAG: voltage-gated chloride channel family protein [Chitinophagaceae bacterium]|nr:voltage-gated chloride channel family protein [Chitinophagaceae bacterium]
MKKIKSSFEQVFILSHLFKWTIFSIPVAAITGSLVALFLWLLDEATKLRQQQNWLLFLLPFAGVVIYLLYKYFGKNSEAGNNLIIDEIHEPGGGVPARMAPLVLITTIITHLFGGSAGREGTAVQIGGSMASLLAKWFRLTKDDTKIILMAGIAAGFGAVFGTPVTGTVFALEVLVIGSVNYAALLPCFIASVLSNLVCDAWNIHHTHYNITVINTVDQTFSFIHFNFRLLVTVIAAGICFGLAGYMFAMLTHNIKRYSNQFIQTKWLIPFIGGCIIIVLAFVVSKDYLGLGVTNPDGGVSIISSFTAGGAGYFSWFWKLLFTAITIGMGFKGGEVTPLFFIGAALGNTIAMLTGAPVDLLAGIGFISVFAGATNTPIACTIMGVELFGGEYILYYAVGCFTAYYFSGHAGIYSSQRVVTHKGG